MPDKMNIPNEIEVCVVGGGSAALCTAIAAKEAGAAVLILEKAPKERVGGDLRYCGGFRAVNAEYSNEQFYGELMKVTRGRADPELTRIMVDESSDMIDWLTGLKVKWRTSSGAGMSHISVGGGYGLLMHLISVAEDKGIRILYDAKAVGLQTDDYGSVCGVHVKRMGERTQTIKCGAVVLACGGYSANPEMMCKYFDRHADTMHVRGARYNTGDGIVMAEKVGAKLDWMGDFHGIPEHYDSPRVEGGGVHMMPYRMGIWINLNGERFINEGEDTEDKTYVKVGKEIFAQPGNMAFLVFDEALKNMTFRTPYDSLGAILRRPPPDMELPDDLQKRHALRTALADVYYKADTVEALAEELGVPSTTLKQTIDDYNENILETGGVNATPSAPHARIPKTGWAYHVATPPYYAYPAKCGITFTFGGCVANANGEVLDKEENVISGLYAVGALVPGIFYYNYAAGSAMTRNAVFGRRAGRNAAEYAKRRVL